MSNGIETAKVVEYYNGMLPYMKEYHRGKHNGRLVRVNRTLSKIIQPNMKVLDVGCGTGIISKHMADLGAKVLAIDIAPDLVEYAKKKSFHKNITYLVEDIHKFDTEQWIDLIVFADVIEHIPPDQLFGIFRRLTGCNTHDEAFIYVNIPDANFLK